MCVNVSDFLKEKEALGCSEATLIFYRSCLDRFSVFLDLKKCEYIDFNKSLYIDYVAYLKSCRLSPISIQSYIRGLRCFNSWSISSGAVDSDYNKFCLLPKAPKPLIVPLFDAEIAAIYSTFKSDFFGVRNKAIFSLFLGSGIRLQEALAPFSSLSLDYGFLKVLGKGSKERFVPLSNTFIRDYSVYRVYDPGSASLFSSCSGAPLTYDGLKDIFRKIAKESGVLRLYPHLCRHTFATRFLEEGGDLFVLKEILGHSSVEICKRYIHMSSNAVQRKDGIR